MIDPFEDSGRETVANYETDAFTHLVVDGIFNITIIQNSQHKLKFIGGENILDRFSYKAQNGKLIVKHDYNNWLHNLDIPILEIHVNELNEIRFNSSTTLKSQQKIKGNKLSIFVTEEADIVELSLDLNYQQLDFDSRGSSSGKHIFSGYCPKAHFTLNSSNNVFASKLEAENVSIGHNGLGDARVWAKKTLGVRFYNSGDVFYKGKPKISVERIKINNQKATGKVIQME
jgi:hypothetical protein